MKHLLWRRFAIPLALPLAIPSFVGLLIALPAEAQDVASPSPPRLPDGMVASEQTFQAQRAVPYLSAPYVGVSPKSLEDGIAVGRFDGPGSAKAVAGFLAADKAGAFKNLDSVLLWQDGKLLFEYYNRRGRVDAPHYAMSITKTMTSITLARAMQLGHVAMDDLDKSIVDLLPGIDRTDLQAGTESITLRDALMMKSGLRWTDRKGLAAAGIAHKKQKWVQRLLELCEPVTAAGKTYKYAGTDPSLVMAVVDAKVPGDARDFIRTELVDKLGGAATTPYVWENQVCGLPKCGAGSNWSSRALLKVGILVFQGGVWEGESLLHPDYMKQVLDTGKGDGYFYFFHNRAKRSPNINFISGVGAGGQYMSVFPDAKLVAVATAHNKGNIAKPLDALLDLSEPLRGP